MSASPYRCDRCGRIGIAAIGDGRKGEPIAPIGQAFDVDDCGGRQVVITVEEYEAAVPVVGTER